MCFEITIYLHIHCRGNNKCTTCTLSLYLVCSNKYFFGEYYVFEVVPLPNLDTKMQIALSRALPCVINVSISFKYLQYLYIANHGFIITLLYISEHGRGERRGSFIRPHQKNFMCIISVLCNILIYILKGNKNNPFWHFLIITWIYKLSVLWITWEC